MNYVTECKKHGRVIVLGVGCEFCVAESMASDSNFANYARQEHEDMMDHPHKYPLRFRYYVGPNGEDLLPKLDPPSGAV
jgi:hypothetical protein